MRFKAKLSPSHVELLHNLISPISRLTPLDSTDQGNFGGTLVYIDNDKLILSTRGGCNSSSSNTASATQGNVAEYSGILCFAELITTHGIFLNHVIESVERDNAILMEVCLVQWRTALRSVLARDNTRTRGAGTGEVLGSLCGDTITNVSGGRRTSGITGYEVTLKLSKRKGLPHLCLDSKGSGSDGIIEVHHAIPVRIRKVEELQYHVPPKMGMPDVQVLLPRDRPLKNVVERLRAISPHMYIEGSMAGILTLRTDGEGSSIRTTYNKLTPLHQDVKTSEDGSFSQNKNNGEPVICNLKLDTKKLHACLHWQGTLYNRDLSSAVLCMWENEMLVMDVTLNPEIGRFMYYIPVHFLSEDWD